MLCHLKVVLILAVLAVWIFPTEGQGGNKGQRRPGSRNPGRNGGNRSPGNRGGGNRGGPGNRAGNRGQGRGPGAGAGTGGATRAAVNGTRPGRPARFCEKIMVPMCKGQIGYEYTRLPNQYGHRTQAEVMEALEPFWPFMDMDCSPNFRLTACSTYLPKCIERRRITLPPCRQACMKAKRQCRSAFAAYKRTWPTQFSCSRFPRLAKNRPGVCVAPIKRAPTPALAETTCISNTVPLCGNLSFNQAFIPNMFWQSSLSLISQELSQYSELVDTRCNVNLPFFLCGIYLPFCQDAATEFAVPCRNICEEVRTDCEDDLLRVYGIHWPGKLQCHRYPEATNGVQQCVQPSDTEIIRSPDPEDEYEDEDEE